MTTSIVTAVAVTTTTTTIDPPLQVLEQRKPSMAERIDAEIDENPLGHQYVVQATISVDKKVAKRAAFRGSFRSEEGMRIDALEVMCHVCRRTFDAVQALDAAEMERVADLNEGLPDDERQEPDLNCPGQIDNAHLIGGDLSVRAKRIIHEPMGPIHHHVIDRRGMNGYIVGR